MRPRTPPLGPLPLLVLVGMVGFTACGGSDSGCDDFPAAHSKTLHDGESVAVDVTVRSGGDLELIDVNGGIYQLAQVHADPSGTEDLPSTVPRVVVAAAPGRRRATVTRGADGALRLDLQGAYELERIGCD